MPTKKSNRAKEIIGKIFKDGELAFGLREFDGIDIFNVLEITEEEKGRYYLKDLKSGSRVEAVFRKLVEPNGESIIRYGLKFRPVGT